MNIQIRCELILSKKLEKICEPGEPIEVRIGAIKGNRGEAVIRLVTKDGVSLDDVVKMGETNFGIIPVDAGEEAPSLTDARPVHLLFTKGAVITPENPAPVTVATEKQPEVAPVAPTPKNAKPIEAAVPAPAVAAMFAPIGSYAELMEELMKVPGIDTPFPEMKPKAGYDKMSRQEAEEYERKLASMPRLMRSVYVGNMAHGGIVLNDLNQTMKFGEVMDLSRLPARRL